MNENENLAPSHQVCPINGAPSQQILLIGNNLSPFQPPIMKYVL